jgi:hypothetical protein
VLDETADLAHRPHRRHRIGLHRDPPGELRRGRTLDRLDTSSEVVRIAAADHRPVVFEVDEHDGWSVWSVIVRGTMAETDDFELPDGTELRSMLPTVKRTRLRVTPDEITGRLFDQAP